MFLLVFSFCTDQALVSLHRLGAIDANGAVTITGRKMSCFPVEPCLARIIVEAASGSAAASRAAGTDGVSVSSLHARCLADACIMVGMSTVDSVWAQRKARGSSGGDDRRRMAVAAGGGYNKPELGTGRAASSGGGTKVGLALKGSVFTNLYGRTPSDSRSSTSSIAKSGYGSNDVDHSEYTSDNRNDQEENLRRELAQQRLSHPLGDFFTNLNIYKEYLRSDSSGRWCAENFVNPRAMRQCRRICEQLATECVKGGLCGSELHALVGRDASGAGAGTVAVSESCSHREHEGRLQNALVAGLFMNAARVCSSGGGLLATKALYRSLSDDDEGGGRGSVAACAAGEESIRRGGQLTMFRIHPICCQGMQRAPDCVVYQVSFNSSASIVVFPPCLELGICLQDWSDDGTNKLLCARCVWCRSSSTATDSCISKAWLLCRMNGWCGTAVST